MKTNKIIRLLFLSCCIAYSAIAFGGGGSSFPYKYNVKTKTGSGTVYADTKDVFNPTRKPSITNQSGNITLPLIDDVTKAYQDFYLDAMPAQGYGFVQWRKVDSDGTTLKTIGNNRKSKIKETLGNSESVFYYEADFEETKVSVGAADPDKCQAFIDKEINHEGDVVVLTASTNGDYQIYWTKNGETVSHENPFILTVTSETAHYVANVESAPKLPSGKYYRIRSANPNNDYTNDHVKIADSWFYMTGIVGSAKNVFVSCSFNF